MKLLFGLRLRPEVVCGGSSYEANNRNSTLVDLVSG